MAEQPLDQLKAFVDRASRSIGKIDDGEQRFRIRARGIVREWAEVEATLKAGALQVAAIWGDTRLTLEARRAGANEAITELRAFIDEHLEAMRTQTDELIDELRRRLRPPRPEPADAAQEAAIGNLKDDLRMVLDGVPPAELVQRLLDELRDAVHDGDDLAVWLLAASPWPARYFKGRGVPARARMFDQEAADIVAGDADDQARANARLLEALEARDGLRGALIGMSHFARMRLNQLAARGARVET